MSQSTGGYDWGQLIGGMGGNPLGSITGSSAPDWDFPKGKGNLPDIVTKYFFRGDAGPSGINEAEPPTPEAIDALRKEINAGTIVPKNQAAQQIAGGYGGLRAGDIAPGAAGVLGPMMNDMPSGMSPEYWSQANQLISTGVQAKIKQAEDLGYFNGVPTLQRQQIEQQMAQGWADQFRQQFLANEQQRSNMAQEGMTQQQINNQFMSNMAQTMGGTIDPQTGQFKQTEQGREFDTSTQAQQLGYMNGQSTLAREQQAWNQQKDVAQAASNPRDYIYAQMLGNARGGLAGQAPTNQMGNPYTTTGGPPPGLAASAYANGSTPNAQTAGWTMGAQGLPSLPGNNANPFGGSTPQNPNQGFSPLAATQPPGTSGQGTMSQMGSPGAGTGGQDGQAAQANPLANPQAWGQWWQQANQAQQQARQAMGGAMQDGAQRQIMPNLSGFQGLNPVTQYGQPGQAGQATDGQAAPQQMSAWMGLPQNGDYAARLAAFKAQQGAGGFNQYQGDPSQMLWEQSRQGQTPQGGQGLQGQYSWYGQQAQPEQPGLGFQSPGYGYNPQSQQPQYTTSAFTQSLLQNRMVPQSGALQTQGQYMTQPQMQSALNLNKVRAQDYLRGNYSEQQGFKGTASMAGFSDEDTDNAVKNNLPSFRAPSSGGSMI